MRAPIHSKVSSNLSVIPGLILNPETAGAGAAPSSCGAGGCLGRTPSHSLTSEEPSLSESCKPLMVLIPVSAPAMAE